jgi:hypothetical protein
MKIKMLFVGGLFLASQTLAGDLAKFRLYFEAESVDAPVSIPLDGIQYNTDRGDLLLYETTDAGLKPVPSQIEPGHSARLWFIPDGTTPANTSREFVLKMEKAGADFHADPEIKIRRLHHDLQLVYSEQPILSYRFDMTFPPEGINPLYRRSGYIHPLWSPGGEVLTRIQPSDHYHHYGIWGPWTKTHIDEREVDFWNLAKGQGTVQFSGFTTIYEGAVFSGFQALQQHMDFGAAGEDQIAMNEILDIRAWNISEEFWVIDYTTSITSPLEHGIMLDAYRYGGGIGFRALQKWHKDNCTLLTSEGKPRADADGSFARWCMIEGESISSEGRSGILFLSHPSNRMHPEPMRVWPLDVRQGRGDMFFEFTPIRYEDWKIEPNQQYTLKYRMVVFDGRMDAPTAERFWNAFATLPQVTFNEINRE